MLHDRTGHPVSGATVEALALFETALAQLHCLIGNPLQAADAAIAAAPDFAMAHLLRAYLYLSRMDVSGIAPARRSLATARRPARTERETLHVLAAEAWAGGRLAAAAACFDHVLIANPRDSLALQMAYLIDFHRGDMRSLHVRVRRILPAWSAALPHLHATLHMLAFGLEQPAGRHRRNVDPRAPGALENFMAVHNWWHLVLHHLDREEHVETPCALSRHAAAALRQTAMIPAG
jgi:hypothetical protein